MRFQSLLLGALGVGFVLSTTAPAFAERGWRGGWHGGWHEHHWARGPGWWGHPGWYGPRPYWYGRPVYYAPRPVYYGPGPGIYLRIP